MRGVAPALCGECCRTVQLDDGTRRMAGETSCGELLERWTLPGGAADLGGYVEVGDSATERPSQRAGDLQAPEHPAD